MRPSEEDLGNYSFMSHCSPHFAKPELFLKEGDRVRALFRIFDTPDHFKSDWGCVHAEAGDRGTVVHVEKDCWPTVKFDLTGTATCVTDFEVEEL